MAKHAVIMKDKRICQDTSALAFLGASHLTYTGASDARIAGS